MTIKTAIQIQLEEMSADLEMAKQTILEQDAAYKAEVKRTSVGALAKSAAVMALPVTIGEIAVMASVGAVSGVLITVASAPVITTLVVATAAAAISNNINKDKGIVLTELVARRPVKAVSSRITMYRERKAERLEADRMQNLLDDGCANWVKSHG